jgi:hypothetical protein
VEFKGEVFESLKTLSIARSRSSKTTARYLDLQEFEDNLTHSDSTSELQRLAIIFADNFSGPFLDLGA